MSVHEEPELPEAQAMFKPLRDGMIVDSTEFNKGDETTESGLVIKQADAKKKTNNIARVLEVGEDVTLVKAGDVIVFPYGNGTLIPIDPHLKQPGRLQFMITERRVLAVLDDYDDPDQ